VGKIGVVMTKSKKKYRRKRQKQFPVLPVVLGGLLVVFAVLAMASPKTENSTTAQNSVVPQKVDYIAPELFLQNLNGEAESLADYHGQVVLVNNWATWCPPCKAEMPTLVAYHNEHMVDGFSVIAVEAGEPMDVVSQFATSYQMSFPV